MNRDIFLWFERIIRGKRYPGRIDGNINDGIHGRRPNTVPNDFELVGVSYQPEQNTFWVYGSGTVRDTYNHFLNIYLDPQEYERIYTAAMRRITL